MTSRYDGNEIYTIFIGNREIILTSSEIEEIKSWNFETNDYQKSREELLEQIENLEYLISDVKYSIKNNEVESLDEVLKLLEK